MKKLLIFLVLSLIASSSYAFTLRDVENRCEVWRWSESWGDIECSSSDMRIVEQKCEAWFSDPSENYAYIECRGSDLRPIENRCTAWMYSDSYGYIQC